MTGCPDTRCVEFVCVGNICRSPFAAGAAVALGVPAGRVRSSGLWAEPGRRSPPEAAVAADELGVQLGGHRARRFDPAAVGRADWVLAMEFGQLAEVKRLLGPDWGGSAELLGRHGPGAGVEIPDPFGGPVARYRTIYRLIRDAVAGWWAGPGGAG